MSTGKKEARRQRGEIACAECRRLKVRCSKTIPCETCVKRGTSALCPNGTIPPGDGSRFVLAAEDHLRRKMTKMEERMHALEDALAIVQSLDSSEPHDLLAHPFPLEGDDDTPEPEDVKDFSEYDASGLTDAFGSLHMLGDHGASRFFGPTGGSESLLLKAKEIESQSPHQNAIAPQELDPSYLPEEINIFYQSFPFTPSGIPAGPVQSLIESFLPSAARATALCETLLEHLTWMFSIVSRQHLVGELIPAIYARNRPPNSRTYGPHDLALLLIAIGIGVLVDLSLPPYHPEAQHYYRLARAALGLQSVLSNRSIVTVKCLHLMSIYNGMSGKESNLEHSYSLLNFSAQIAFGIGFHTDPSHFGFEGKEAYDRRTYFWNLLQATLWQSLVTGRPPVTSGAFIDCKIPSLEEEMTFQQGEVPLGFGLWSYRYLLECLLPVSEATVCSNPPSYRSILALDRKIRSFDVPISSSPQDSARASSSMQRFVREHYRELTLLYLHRGFFAQALIDNPTNPQQSVHGQSFITAYKCACAVLDSTEDHHAQQPLLITRVWRVWSNAFSASVIIGTVAMRIISLKLDPPPLEKLEQSCTLFQSAAKTSSRAQRALPILMTMHRKALLARQQVVEDPKTGFPTVEPYDELAMFGGRTGLVLPKRPLASNKVPFMNSTRDFQITSIPSSSQSRSAAVMAPQAVSNDPYQSHYQMHPSIFGDELPPHGSNLPTDWEGLYREIPEPSYSFGSGTGYSDTMVGLANPPGEGVMLEDRWTSFMHQYGVIGQIQTQPHS